MNPVRTKKVSIVMLIVGVAIALGGIALFLKGEQMLGVILLITGVVIAMICRVFLSFFTTLAFERTIRRR